MTTYVYESVPAKPGEEPRHFEFKQRMSDAPLTKHPDTGEPIRRVVSGGIGVLSKGKTGGTSSSGGSCCGAGCGCH